MSLTSDRVTRHRDNYNIESVVVENDVISIPDGYEVLANLHATMAKELLANYEISPTAIPTITHPNISQAMVHAQLSTTYAVLAGK